MPKKNDDTSLNLLRPQKPNDWFIYQVFYIAAQSRTLDKAAEKAGLSGHYISRILAQLEDALEIKLIIRGVNHLELTKAGKEIYKQLKDAHKIFDNIGCYAERSKHGYTDAPLSLAAPYYLASTLITPFMLDFAKEYPDVRFYLTSLKYDEFDPLYQADCALILGEPKRSSYCADYLYTSKMNIYASKEYLEKNGVPETLDELLETGDIISRYQDRDIRTPKDEWIKPFINNHETQGIIGNNIQFIVDNVLKHKGFGILSNSYTLTCPIEKVPLEEVRNPKRVPVYLAYPREHKEYKGIIALREFLLKITEPLR